MLLANNTTVMIHNIPPKLSDDWFEVVREQSLSQGPPDPPGF